MNNQQLGINENTKPYVDLISRVILIISGLIISSTLIFKYSFSARFNIFTLILTVIILLATLYNLFDRNFYLPFLGHTVFPIPKNNFEKPLQKDTIMLKLDKLPPNTRVVYWGAQTSNTTFDDPQTAYGDHKNVKIGKTDVNGEITVQLAKPSGYMVKKLGQSGVYIKPHIHYRYELKMPGMFSEIFTKDL